MVTTAGRQPAGSAAAWRGWIGHRLLSANGRPPPAFYGVPPTPVASNASGRVSTRGELISVSPESIHPGMGVYDFDGLYVGRVKDVDPVEIVVERRWRGARRIPLEQILAVLDRRVVLTVPHARAGRAEAALRTLRERPLDKRADVYVSD